MGHNTDGSVNLAYTSDKGGVFVITLDGAGVGQGADQACSSFSVKPEAGQSITFNLCEAGAADATDPPLDATYTAYHFSNTNKIKFFGTAGKKVYGYWRN